MNKTELIEHIANNADISKAAAARALESTIDAVKKTLKKGGTVSLVGFGTFAVGKRAARTGRNPRTGDTIKIKRHGSMGTAMQFYKMPVTQGGRNDVVFIVQEPNDMYPDREFGGMYAVRPRDPGQKQHGPHKSNADSFLSQYDSTRGNIDVEAKFLKPMGD